uniref:hypothetical protein n=1 Tax=Agathobacter sp. TaxID=2021311 RepID=UPI004056D941
MTYAEYQESLRKEVQPRNIEVKLSREECEKLMDLCGRNGITLGKLIGSFVGDLVEGSHSNGAEGRDLAQRWFSKTLEKDGSDGSETLLEYIFDKDGSTDPFLNLLEDIELAKEDVEGFEKEPEGYWLKAEEVEERKKDLEYLEQLYREFINGFMEIKPEADLQKEISNVKEWAGKKACLSGTGYVRDFPVTGGGNHKEESTR